MKDKKVLLVATVQSHIAQFHKPLIEMLKDNGYKVDIAAANNLKEKDGLEINKVDKIFDVKFSRSPFNKNNIKAYKQLKNIIKENNYEIIHCNTPVGGILTRLVKKNTKISSKIIYTAHRISFLSGFSYKKLDILLYY